MSVDFSTQNGWFKVRYGDVQRAVPNFAEVQKRVPFEERSKQGKTYNFPVRLTRSHGVTFNSDGTAFALNSAVSPESDEAIVSGTELVIQENISYGAMSRAEGSQEAFGDIFDETILSMRESSAFYLELCMLYGGTSLAEVNTTPDQAGNQQTATIKTASYAPGIWAQMENAYIDIYDDDYNPLRNLNTATQVDAFEPSTQLLTFTGLEAELDTVVIGDLILPRGAYGKWFDGIDKICTNTGSLFSIDASVYGLWKAQTYSASSAAMSLAKINAAISKAVVRGLMEDTVCFLSVFTWSDLMNNLMTLRRFAESTKREVEIGSQSIKLYGLTGAIELVPHPMVKAGECFILPTKRLKRIGSTDSTFRLKGSKNDNFFFELASNAGVGVRCYWDQAIVPTQPAKFVKVTTIVNDSLPNID